MYIHDFFSFGLGQEYSLDDVCETLYGPNFQFRRFPYLGVCSYFKNCCKVEICSYNFFSALDKCFWSEYWPFKLFNIKINHLFSFNGYFSERTVNSTAALTWMRDRYSDRCSLSGKKSPDHTAEMARWPLLVFLNDMSSVILEHITLNLSSPTPV